jgi:hypothetical protein
VGELPPAAAQPERGDPDERHHQRLAAAREGLFVEHGDGVGGTLDGTTSSGSEIPRPAGRMSPPAPWSAI